MNANPSCLPHLVRQNKGALDIALAAGVALRGPAAKSGRKHAAKRRTLESFWLMTRRGLRRRFRWARNRAQIVFRLTGFCRREGGRPKILDLVQFLQRLETA